MCAYDKVVNISIMSYQNKKRRGECYLMAKVPQVPIPAVYGFLCYWDRHIMLLSIFNSIFSPCNIPFPPRSHNIQLWIQSKEGELKANLITQNSKPDCVRQKIETQRVINLQLNHETCLIISFSCASMRDSISSYFFGNIHHGLFFEYIIIKT